MTLNAADRRSEGRAFTWIFGTVFGLIMLASFLLKPGPSEYDKELAAACRERYSTAHTLRDSLLVDNWIPLPKLQAGGSRRCHTIVFR